MSLTPPDRAALRRWDATETLARLRAGDVTQAEVLEAAIARAEAARGLGAIVTTLYDRARAAVAAGPTGPLAGVPTFVKDLAPLEGARITWGSRATGETIARATDPFVRRFEATGLVTLGKSATPELGLTATTEPLGRPPARNPWDPSRSTGGSSGGAGCLVAAGVVPIAHATDGGGSIRIPAACCGLVGLKPSRGRLDLTGSDRLPLNIACDGVVTRSVRDTVLFHESMEATGRGRLPPIGHPSATPPAKLRMALFVDAPIGTPVHPDVQRAVREAGALCRSLGHSVEEIPCPFPGGLIDDFLRYWGFVAWVQARTGRWLMTRQFDRAKLEPWTVGIGGHFLSAKVETLRAVRRLRAFARDFAAIAPFDVLLSPALAEPPPALGHLATDLDFETVFARLRAYAPFTPLYNAAGNPALVLPLGKSGALPVGVQLAAMPGRDRLLLELGLSLEAAQPWEALAPEEAWAKAA